jgi:uncharacterized protein with PQ loop repeat
MWIFTTARNELCMLMHTEFTNLFYLNVQKHKCLHTKSSTKTNVKKLSMLNLATHNSISYNFLFRLPNINQNKNNTALPFFSALAWIASTVLPFLFYFCQLNYFMSN